MCCTSQRCVNIGQTKKRTITLAILICFIAVSLLSGAFILTRSCHEHDRNGVGGTCATCAQIQNAENLLKQLGTAALAATSVIASLFSVAAVTQAFSAITATLTPVTLKIRMNN